MARVLITNDDGIDAPGLAALVRALRDSHEVTVGAPDRDFSGSGTSIGSLAEGAVVDYRVSEIEGVPAFALSAPPAFSVLAFAMEVFGDRPDIVVSGINDGFNTGRLIISSSTVGATLVAQSLGLRALAVSAGFPPRHRFDTAAEVAASAVQWLEFSPPGTCLNVNVPNLAIEELRGTRTARLAHRSLMGLRLHADQGRIELERYDNDQGLGHETDASLVRAGYVSVSEVNPIGTAEAGSAAAAINAALPISSRG